MCSGLPLEISDVYQTPSTGCQDRKLIRSCAPLFSANEVLFSCWCHGNFINIYLLGIDKGEEYHGGCNWMLVIALFFSLIDFVFVYVYFFMSFHSKNNNLPDGRYKFTTTNMTLFAE
jgi:hypothetical protein